MILEKILAVKRAEVAAMEPSSVTTTPTRDVLAALRRSPGDSLRLIAEFKRKSPSAGVLLAEGSAADRAKAYVAGGASMISVLTDSGFFGGSFEDLEEVRRAVDVPLLAKEFVIDEKQIAKARASGADAILLIVRCVPRDRLLALAEESRRVGLEPFVEVVTEDEVAIAVEAKARLIGVNARDLDTLTMNANHAASVLAAIPPSITAVHLSGLKSREDIARISRTTASAALMGEALMRTSDPTGLLRSLLAAP